LALLEVIEVSKFFGALKALNRVSLSVEEGQILGLIGPNGSGKTTLFNVITGYLPLTSGKILFEGKIISGLSPYKICRLGIARTFQTPKPFAGMTVYENLLVPMKFLREDLKKASDMKQEAVRILEKLGLVDKFSVFASSLTLYEQRLLELARALICKPKLLLLDEVMAGLNPAETAQIVKILREIRESYNITLFVIEHNLRALMNIADSIVVLCQGEKIAEGKPEVILNSSKVVEAYLGEPYVA
jgi:branched-chain amino acid transport system ATP-binding protein